MKTDINVLVGEIIRVEDAGLEVTAEDREILREIASWSMEEARQLFAANLETEEAFKELKQRAATRYPELNEESLHDILLYVQFYTFK